MAKYQLKPFSVDMDSYQAWKQAWIELWLEEDKLKKKGVVLPAFNPVSEWRTIEKDVPWCPIHFRYCIMDRSLQKFDDWSHS